jgi:hypothetical protein
MCNVYQKQKSFNSESSPSSHLAALKQTNKRKKEKVSIFPDVVRSFGMQILSHTKLDSTIISSKNTGNSFPI